MTDLTRRYVLSAALTLAPTLVLGAPYVAVPPERPRLGVRAPIPPRRPGFETAITKARLGGVTGALIGSVPMYSLLSNQAFSPASVMKMLTSLYAIDRLGAQHRFATRLLATGPIEGGRVRGDLILVGGGDPVLSTDDLAVLVQRLRAAGINGADGFAVWAGALPYRAEIEPLQRDHHAYNPSISGLNLNFNRVRFEWRRAKGRYDLRLDARTEELRPVVRSSSIKLSPRALPVYEYEGDDGWTVAQSALGPSGARWLPVRRPDLYAADVFRTLAKAAGVQLPVPRVAERAEGAELARHESPPLNEIARGMMKYSTNLTAEVLGQSASGGLPLAQSARAMETWLNERYGLAMTIADHSGLSERSRMTPRELVKVLEQEKPRLIPLMKTVKFRGDAIPPAQIRAKTGSLYFVSTLAGYLVKDERVLPFAIMSGDLPRRSLAKSSPTEPPQGATAWAARARVMQDDLLRRASLAL